MKPNPGRLLLVTGHEETRSMMTPILWGCGYAVTTAKNGIDALHLARIERFAGYVLDFWLPDGTGVKLCRQLRAFDPQTPILICSTAVCQPIRQQALAASAQADRFTLVSPQELELSLGRLLNAEAVSEKVMRKSA